MQKLDKPIIVELELNSKDSLCCDVCGKQITNQTVELKYIYNDGCPNIACAECRGEK